MFSSLSLKYRIAIIIFCLEAIMMTVVLQQTLGQSFEASSKQIHSNERAILELVSGMSKSALITEEYAELQPYIVHLASVTEVTKLFLTNANKTIVISSSLKDIGNQLPDLKEQKNHSWQTIEITNASGRIGVLAIEFSNKALVIAYENARDFGISIALVGMLVIAFIGILVGYLLTRRLDHITNTARRLANGDYSARTKIHGEDEIGKLAAAFNKMVQGLLESKDELSHTLETLKEKEQYLAITLNSIGDAVITTDASGNVSNMNPVAENLTGWSLQEAQGQSLKKIFPIVNAATREPIENPVDKVIATGETIYLSNHTTLISKSGSEFQIADSAAAIRDNGHILGMVLVFNDVTEQYRLRESAKQNVQRLADAQKMAMLGNWELDLATNGLSWSDEIFRIFEIDSEIFSATYEAFLNAIHPDDRDKVNRAYTQSLENKRPYDIEHRLLMADGRVKFVHERCVTVFDKAGKPLFSSGTMQDISDRVQMEETLRRSLKMDALGKLTGGIAHDYNNMLGVILGYSEIIESKLDGQTELIKYIHQIQHAGERGANLTKKLLTFSRQQSSENKIVNLNALLQDSQLMLEKTMTARINLVFELAKDLWLINIDISDLEDAILNMSINAMHSIEGNGQVTFSTHNEIINEIDAQQIHMVPGEYVLLSITDNGCGMDKKIKEKIFDPFYSTKGELGTGLGLSQVYGFVQRSKGHVEVYSEQGHGSRFTLYFPRHYGSEREEKQFEEGDEADLTGNQTILVVDDEPALVTLTSHILSQQGYRVFSASSGKEALLILEKEHMDVLLSDVIMPEMDGYQLAVAVLKKYPNIKIQLASGFSDDRHINNIGSSLLNTSLHQNLLYKPYHSKKLLLRIRELLDDTAD